MITSSNPTPAVTEPEDSSSELSRIWRAIGRLEGTTSVLLENQRHRVGRNGPLCESTEPSSIREGYGEFVLEMREDFRMLCRRLDHLFYLVVGGGAVLLAAIVSNSFL